MKSEAHPSANSPSATQEDTREELKHTVESIGVLDTNVGRLLMRFAEKSRDVFWIRNSDYSKQLYISPSYEEIWGRSREELYRHPEVWGNFLHPDDRKHMQKSISKRSPDAADGECYLTEFRCIRPDGEVRWIRDESFSIFDDNGVHVGFAGIAQDITKEKELERAKEMAKIANQSKSEFLANMSHDLRTPLNWLLGAADILNKRNNSVEKAKLLEMILDGGRRILYMVEEILDYSKLEAGKLPLYREPLNFRQSIEEVVGMMAAEANNKQLALIVDYPDAICRHVQGDVQRLRRILMNLLGNAIKFTSEGYIQVKVREKHRVDSHVQLELTVQDTGIGIPSDRIDRIFERFEKAEPSYHGKYKGVGLGLAIVKKFVEAMSGKISVQSKVDQGSHFHCCLPLARQETYAVQSFWQRHLRDKLSVLIVDDMPERSGAYASAMASENLVSYTSQELAKRLGNDEETLPEFDIVLVDDQLQHLAPLNLAKRFQSAGSSEEGPLLLLCKRPGIDADILDAQSLGYHDVLTKPLLPTELTRHLSGCWLERRMKHQSAQELVKQLQPEILLVEDELFGQKIVAMLLEEELGCKVTIAENAEVAHDILHQQSFDLVLMDIGLPDESGLTLTKRIREHEGAMEMVPIVALTAHASDEMISECQDVGMNGHLAKPASSEDLLIAIQQHVLQLQRL